MPKLFVAVELPRVATAGLSGVQPLPRAGVRLPAPDQMHLTLHYLGEAGIEAMAAALQSVATPAFSLVFEGVGHFPSAGGATTLWAGVKETAGLLGLHSAVAAALAPAGFRPEARRYGPHVTIARCETGAPPGLVDEFLSGNGAFSLPPVSITSFGLYSSTFVAAVPVYQRLQSFPLLGI